MGDKAAARQIGEYRAALADLRHAVEARLADPTDRDLLEQLQKARAKVRSTERGRTPATPVLAPV